MKKTIHDMLDIYAMKHHSDDMMLMLRDYILDERLNRDDLNDKIVLELGERTPYWNHTELMKVNIENWFATHEDNIKRLVDTLELKYNPLYTTDYTDTEHEHTENDDTVKDSGTISDNGTISDSGTVSDEGTVNDNGTVRSAGTTSDGNIENTVSAYDSGTYQPQDKSTHHDETDVTNTTNMTATTDMTKSTDMTKDTDMTKTTNMTKKSDLDEVRDRTLEHHGKEGDKTYQELIEAERRLAEFNIYDWIVNQLDSEICLGVF